MIVCMYVCMYVSISLMLCSFLFVASSCRMALEEKNPQNGNEKKKEKPEFLIIGILRDTVI